jgi:hypothetical protein
MVKIQVRFKFDKNNGRFTWRPVHLYSSKALDSSQSDTSFKTIVEEIETHCMICTPPPTENRDVYYIMWRNVVQSDRTQMAVLCVCVTKTINTLRMCTTLFCGYRGYTKASQCYMYTDCVVLWCR